MKINNPATRKTAPIVFLVLSVIGFLDATYLAIEHFMGKIPPCSITDGCASVLTSKWATVAGIPIAVLGVAFYLFLLVLTILYLKSKNQKYMLAAAAATVFGLIADFWFVGLQLFVIKQICFYCMVSAVTSTLLFVVGLFIFLSRKGDDVVSEVA